MKKLFLFLIFFTATSFSQKKEGQNLIDSLLTALPKMKEDTLKVMALNDISSAYQTIDPEIGYGYAKKGLIIANKLQWKDGIADSYRVTGLYFTSLDDFENALKNYNKALSHTKNKKLLSKIYRHLGLLYTYKNHYPKALKYDNLSLKLCEEINDLKGQAAVISNIGIIHFDLNNYSKAIEYYDKARKMNEKMQNIEYLISNLGNLGNCYLNLKKYSKALEFFDKAIEIADKQNNKYSKAICLSSKGQVFYHLKQYDLAINFSNQSLKLNRKIEDESTIASNIGTIGDSYLAKAIIEKDKILKTLYLQKSYTNLNEALLLEKKLGVTKEVAVDYTQIAIIQELRGDFKGALESERCSKIYLDSVFNSENKETIKNLEDKREIELRDNQIKINKLSLEAKEKQKWILISGLGFLAIIGSLLFYQSQNRKKNNSKLLLLNNELHQANKTKARFFSILNHDLRSPVSNLIHFLHLQKDSPELLDDETKSRMEAKTISGAEDLLSSMEDILLWSKGQMENFKPQQKKIPVSELFDDIRKHFSTEERVAISFEDKEEIELNIDGNYLKTIIRNLTGNAIKALNGIENPMITWKAYQLNNDKYLAISDNGIGASEKEFKALYDEKEVIGIKSGLGLHLIRDLAKAINCEIVVDTKINSGTTITLKLK